MGLDKGTVNHWLLDHRLDRCLDMAEVVGPIPTWPTIEDKWSMDEPFGERRKRARG